MNGPSFFDPFSKSADRKVRKLLGRIYLRDGRVEDALDVYHSILRDYPNDEEVLLILGELYRISGRPGAASGLFNRVLALYPASQLAARLASACAGQPEEIADEQIFSPEAMRELVRRLREDDTPATWDAIRNAANPLNSMNTGEPTSDKVHPVRAAVHPLMPALLNLNIRSARAGGRMEVAGALQSLQLRLSHHSSETEGDPGEPRVSKTSETGADSG